jgi:hypothetical protein
MIAHSKHMNMDMEHQWIIANILMHLVVMEMF